MGGAPGLNGSKLPDGDSCAEVGLLPEVERPLPATGQDIAEVSR